jgi:hypothetical protein
VSTFIFNDFNYNKANRNNINIFFHTATHCLVAEKNQLSEKIIGSKMRKFHHPQNSIYLVDNAV